ncbi:MAG: methylornithine synthase PylB [Spirochaetes bacterium]|nr:methylornithine synthase PylB [Spirochaetota bacterium]
MTTSVRFEEIIDKSVKEHPLNRSDIRILLSIREKEKLLRLFDAARSLRRRYFNDTVFLYGFVYFSNYCRNDCTFCCNRRSNGLAVRYRKDRDAILHACRYLAESGVHCIDLTMGEDPFYYASKERFSLLGDCIESLKRESGIPIMLSPGAVTKEVLSAIAEFGITWFACYQETYNRALFNRIRPNQDYIHRLETKYQAKKLGLLIEEGILTGIGESLSDVVESLMAMKRMEAQQVRVMRFVPQKGTPMYRTRTSDKIGDLVTIAVLRLLFPDRLIPASLDIDGIRGLQMRLEAGANVLTSLVPPSMGLSGVAQPTLDIDTGRRVVDSVIPIVKASGLVPASLEEYARWIANEKRKLGAADPMEKEAVS